MRQRTGIVAGLLGASLLLASCGGAPSGGSSSPDDSPYSNTVPVADEYDESGHFDWGFSSFPTNWDPISSTNGADINFYEPVYDRLLREDLDGQIEPMLAVDYQPSADGKTLTLTLREGLTFSDGTPFDADAVKFNLDRSRGEGSALSGELYQIESVDVADELTVTITVSGAVGPLVTALANRGGIMVSPAAVSSGTLTDEPAGIGPYVASEIITGTSVDFELTDGYWDPEAQRVATMTYHFMADDQTRINALKSGELDGAYINAEQIDTMSTSGFVPIVAPSSQFIYLLVNAGKAPYDNPEVRKALNMAIDREAISQGLYDGYCTPQIQPFPSSSPGYSDKVGDGLDVLGYDPEQAKQILEDEGVSSLELSTVTPNVTIYTKLGEVIQDELADVNIDVTLVPMPSNQIVHELTETQSVDSLATILTGINDPDVINSRYISPTALFNVGDVEYPDLLTYGAEGAGSLDPAERKASYEKYMDAWVANPPHLIPICMIHQATAVAPNVSGVSQRANGYPDLRGVAVSAEA
ncbi:ABC transporter substrate-binding protein [Cumulibacter soli]|uniref:ABC transporter substrate-binding protein n=1 Tax=Cumulibacter soli TaxID=2546344 RepID=UPI001419F768|nr:ABC transporter substrate-binding protein [Cumulibacter soli]